MAPIAPLVRKPCRRTLRSATSQCLYPKAYPCPRLFGCWRYGERVSIVATLDSRA